MKKVGLVGIRGMVGQVLFQRMMEEKDFALFSPTFFSTSAQGTPAPHGDGVFHDAYDLTLLQEMDILLVVQGSEYTEKIYPELKKIHWKGYWIDAASSLRMDPTVHIPLEPVNLDLTKEALRQGVKTFAGANCTVSILLLALHGLLKENLIEWISFMSYQAISGAGAKAVEKYLADAKLTTSDPTSMIHNAVPWIDSPMKTESGYPQTKEEWKSFVEGNKILGTTTSSPIPMDGLCVRIGALRSHSLGLTFKLKKNISNIEIEDRLKNAHPYVDFIPGIKEITQLKLNPKAVSGTLKIAVGRLRDSSIDPGHIKYLFATGDQLLWGAAEPLRRVLRTILQFTTD